MKAIVPPSPSAVKRMRKEIHRQCIAETEKYEIELDTVWVYAIRKVSKRKKRPIGKKLMLEIYQAMFEAREEMKEWYQSEDDDGIVETAMRFELRRDGIDVEEMYRNEQESKRLRVRFVNRRADK
jgi:hypothetical protein